MSWKWSHKSGELTLTEVETTVLQMAEIVTFWLVNMVQDCEEDLLMMVTDLVTEEDEI